MTRPLKFPEGIAAFRYGIKQEKSFGNRITRRGTAINVFPRPIAIFLVQGENRLNLHSVTRRQIAKPDKLFSSKIQFNSTYFWM